MATRSENVSAMNISAEEREERVRKAKAEIQERKSSIADMNDAEYRALLKSMSKLNQSAYTPEVLTEKCYEYIDFCGRGGLKVNMYGLANYLGVTHRTLNNWKAKGNDLGEIIDQFQDFMRNSYIQRIEEHTQANIFLLRANGVSDTTKVEVSNASNTGLTEDELQDRISKLGL
jgi:hypothetical protein